MDAALVDGLILLGLVPDHPDLAKIRQTGTPLVGLDTEDFEGVDVIRIEDRLRRSGADAPPCIGYRESRSCDRRHRIPIDEQPGISRGGR